MPETSEGTRIDENWLKKKKKELVSQRKYNINFNDFLPVTGKITLPPFDFPMLTHIKASTVFLYSLFQFLLRAKAFP